MAANRKPRKKSPRKCPWCKTKGRVEKWSDGFWHCGCMDGFCPVSPRTSGQPTEEEAIEVWNAFKV